MSQIEIKHKGQLLVIIDTKTLRPDVRKKALTYGLRSLILDAGVGYRTEPEKLRAMLKKANQMVKE